MLVGDEEVGAVGGEGDVDVVGVDLGGGSGVDADEVLVVGDAGTVDDGHLDIDGSAVVGDVDGVDRAVEVGVEVLKIPVALASDSAVAIAPAIVVGAE